MLFMIEDF